MKFDAGKVTWDKVKNPNDLLKIMQPNPQDPIGFEKKLVRLKNNLRDKYLYLSDQFRHPKTIDTLIHNYFYGAIFNIFYELGDFQGVIGITNILPEFKAGVFFKIWDNNAWTPANARKLKQFSDIIMKEFMLKRLSIQTPDRRMIKFGKIIGFELEGEKPLDFKWGGRLYTTYMLGMYKDKKVAEKPKESVYKGDVEQSEPKKKTPKKKTTVKKTTTKKTTAKKTATKKAKK